MKPKCLLPSLPWVEGASLWQIGKQHSEVRVHGKPQVLIGPAIRCKYQGRGRRMVRVMPSGLGGQWCDELCHGWARYRYGSARMAALAACAAQHGGIAYTRTGPVCVPHLMHQRVHRWKIEHQITKLYEDAKINRETRIMSRTVLPAMLDMYAIDPEARCNFAVQVVRNEPDVAPSRYFFETVTGIGLFWSKGKSTVWWRWHDLNTHNKVRPLSGPSMLPTEWSDDVT